MPWWVPSFDNGMIAGLLTFGCIVVGWIVKELLPFWRARQEAEAKKVEKEAALADTLGVTQIQQSALLERQVGMLHDHGLKLGSHGEMLTLHGTKLEQHGKTLEEIRDEVRRRREHRREDHPS